jgi:hypothetical protein
MDLTVVQAEAVINEAKAGSAYPGPMPDQSDQKLSEAKRIIDRCALARDHGSQNKLMITILGIAGLPTSKQEKQDPVDEVKEKIEPKPVEEPKFDPVTQKLAPEPKATQYDNHPDSHQVNHTTAPSEGAQADSGDSTMTLDSLEQEYLEAADLTKTLEQHNMPVPKDYQGSPPDFPMNVEDLGDIEVRHLHTAFQACAARMHFLATQDESAQHAAKVVYDNRQDELLTKTISKIDPDTDKPKLQKVLDAEIAQDPKYSKYRRLHDKHERTGRQYRKMAELYEKLAIRMNSEWSMRKNDG